MTTLVSSGVTSLTYKYNYFAYGGGVDVYVVDTGIYTGHSTFGGRARWVSYHDSKYYTVPILIFSSGCHIRWIRRR
jgi:subtilisin family serine protease